MNKLQKSISSLLLITLTLPLLVASKAKTEEQLLEEIQNLEEQLSSKREELKILRSDKQPLEIRIFQDGSMYIHEVSMTLDDLDDKTDWTKYYKGRAEILADKGTSQEIIMAVMRTIYSNGWKNLHVDMRGEDEG